MNSVINLGVFTKSTLGVFITHKWQLHKWLYRLHCTNGYLNILHRLHYWTVIYSAIHWLLTQLLNGYGLNYSMVTESTTRRLSKPLPWRLDPRLSTPLLDDYVASTYLTITYLLVASKNIDWTLGHFLCQQIPTLWENSYCTNTKYVDIDL